MYVLAHKAIESVIRGRFGADAWERVKARSGVNFDAFTTNEASPPELTRTLMSAASIECATAVEDLVRETGAEWVRVFAASQGSLLPAWGSSFAEILLALPDLQTRLSLVTPMHLPPWYECEMVAPNRILVRATARDRPLIHYLVSGVLAGFARHFGVTAQVELERCEAVPVGLSHCAFSVTWTEAAR